MVNRVDDKQRKEILARISKATKVAASMSREEARQVLISGGYYTEQGRLSAQYGGKVAHNR